MKAQHLFLAFSLQIIFAGAALAVSAPDDRVPAYVDTQSCGWYDLNPVQSEEGQAESDEEEEPDCE